MMANSALSKIKKHGLFPSILYQLWRLTENPKLGLSRKNRYLLVDTASKAFDTVGIRKVKVKVNSNEIYIDPTCPWALKSFALVPRYDIEEIETVLKSIPKDYLFIDVGANFGSWTFSLEKHFKKILAVEPDPRCFRCLGETKKLKNATHVTLINAGLSNTDTDGFLFEEPGHSGDGRIYEPENKQREKSNPVKIKKLDTLLKELNLLDEKKYFIKMDVQGSEPAVLEGASDLLSRADDLILHTEIHPILSDAGSSIEGYLQTLKKLNLEPVELVNGKIISTNWEKVREYVTNGHKDFCFRKQRLN